MAEIVHRVGIKAAPDQVFRALSTIEGLSGWWTKDTTGDSKVGGALAFEFRPPSGGHVVFDMDVIELTPDKIVRWRVKDGPDEWVGTELEFSLAQESSYTIVLFAHRNWPDAMEFMAHCSMKWATFLLSLRSFVEAGKGRPAPDDLKIDNWN